MRKSLDKTPKLAETGAHSSTHALAGYFRKLAKEREYLESEIAKLEGAAGRQSAIRVELQEALKDSRASEAAIVREDFVAALTARDRMHVRLHGTKHFQWQPLMKDGAKHRNASSAGRQNLKENTEASRKAADERALTAYHKWCAHSARRRELVSLTDAEKLKKYCRFGRPTDRIRRRLQSMLRAGTLK